MFDRHWWQRLYVIIDRLQAKEILASMQDRLQSYHTLMLVYANRTDGEDLFTHYEQAARELRASMSRLREPWLPEIKVKSSAEVIEQLQERYYEEFGDPASDEWQSEFERLQDYWNDPDAEEDEESVDQIGNEFTPEQLRELGFSS